MVKTAVLMGNGVFDSSVKNYREYVDEFVSFANRNKVDCIVLCGGRTSTKSPQTEALSLKRYIAPRLNNGTRILAENKSITALQAVRFAKPMLKIKPRDDITLFCDSQIATKVMWFVMHYWFNMSRKEIEKDALNFISAHYSKQHTTNHIGKWMVTTGVYYKNVEIHPYSIQPSSASAIAQQLVSLVDISALYNPSLYKSLTDATKRRYGIKK
jgi:ribonuclease HI